LILYFRGQRERGYGEEHCVTNNTSFARDLRADATLIIDHRDEVGLTSVTQ